MVNELLNRNVDSNKRKWFLHVGMYMNMFTCYDSYGVIIAIILLQQTA